MQPWEIAFAKVKPFLNETIFTQNFRMGIRVLKPKSRDLIDLLPQNLGQTNNLTFNSNKSFKFLSKFRVARPNHSRFVENAHTLRTDASLFPQIVLISSTLKRL